MVPSVPVRAPSHRVIARLLAGLIGLSLLLPLPLSANTGTYKNPLQPTTDIGTGIVESCADPSVIQGQEPADDGYWYMYCTADPLNDEDRNASGGYNFRALPVLRSTDLVNWEYVGDALAGRPSYAAPGAGLWAPEIEYYPETGNYHLYYTVVDTTFTGGGSAIGVAISDTAEGPFMPVNTPVVEPHAADCCPGSRRNVFDPEVFRTDGPDYIYYGSYFGGVSVRVLSETGLTSDPATQENVAVANKYEGPEVIERDGWYYLFVSATDCCRGPLTGYAVFVGRSQDPTGPFLDRSGVDLNDDEPLEDDTDGRAGGSPVIVGNDNPWVGPGHNTVFQDVNGQWWTIYHAINRNEPYFEDAIDIFPGNCGAEGQPESAQPCGDLNKRPALLDAIDWVDGWPVLNGGAGISTRPNHAPAAQEGDKSNYRPTRYREDRVGKAIRGASDEFTGTALDGDWSWVRPEAATWSVSGGQLHMDVQRADLFVDSDSASVLLQDAPNGNYVVETRVRLDVPAEGCCFNYIQAGLVVYEDDDNYVKLTHASIWNTRQTEWAKELAPVPDGYPRYGNSVVGPPGGVVTAPTDSPLGEWTTLRIVVRQVDGGQSYTAWTKADGGVWEKGMTWRHDLDDASIGLVAMGQTGDTPGEFHAQFEYVRVYKVHR